MQPAIVTMTRHTEIFNHLRDSVDRYEPGAVKIVVTSGGALPHAAGWAVLTGIEPFVFPRNANLGFRFAGPDRDVLLVNDDCELTGPVLATLQQIVDGNPSIGIISPQIAGGVGNERQMVGPGAPGWDESGYYTSPDEHLSGVCLYYPAATRARVGDLDERYDEYGCDDQDYGHRVRLAGLELAVTPLCVVRHGFGDRAQSSSFGRFMSREDQIASVKRMRAKFHEKFPSAPR